MPQQNPTPRFSQRGGDRRGARPGLQRGGASLWYGLGFLLILGVAQLYYLTPSGRVINYSEFKTLIKTGQIADLTIGDQVIRGNLKSGDEKTKAFTTNRVEDPKLTEELDEKGVNYKGEAVNRRLPDVLGGIIPLVFYIVIWRFFFLPPRAT